MVKPMFLTVVLSLAVLSVFPISSAYAAVSTNPTYQTLDLSATPNTTDFLLGIDCSDANFIYTTIHNQGSLARIAKSDGAVTIFDNNSVASGEDWGSVIREPTTGKLFASEKDTGRIRVFTPSSSTYSSISVPQNIAGGVISYTSSYASAPHDITIAGSGIHVFGFSSRGELKATGGYVWEVIKYNYDFTAGEEGVGAVDVSFSGLARIDPNTDTVTRFSIAGSSDLIGLTVDASDSTVLWLSDFGADKLFKFDIDTNTVVATINLPASSKARSIADDGTFLYIAMNEPSGSGNSKILKINKSTEAITTIDTGTAIGGIGKSGTFSVFIADSLLVWTDESGHIGTILLSNNNIKTVINTTGTVSSNHYGCLIGTDVYIAGHGSAVVSSFSIGGGSSESTHGDSCMGDCYAPHLGWDENSKFFYNDGLEINGKKYEIKNQLHNLGNETLVFPVGSPLEIKLKVQDSYPDNVESCEIAFGIEHGKFIKQSASFILGVKRSFDGTITQYSEGNSNLFRNFSANMTNIDKNVYANFTVTPTSHIKHDMFALECKDIHRYYNTYFVNHGMIFKGLSEIGTSVFEYMDDNGLVHVLTLVDPTLENQSLAIDENGDYWSGEFGKFWNKDYVRPDMTGSFSHNHGYDRLDPEFKMIKIGQELLGKQIFNSELIQKTLPPSFTYEITPYERLHDPVPNMMKAQADLATRNLNTKIVK